jgi:hypothetical protein
MKKFILRVIDIITLIASLYFGAWLMIVNPLLDIIRASSMNNLSLKIFGTALLKCIFSTCVVLIIIYVGELIKVLIENIFNKKGE